MKTIVISGAHSGVGKTTLAKELLAVLPGSVFVKFGHHPKDSSNKDLLYPAGTSFCEIRKQHEDIPCLLIESNSILRELTPDCTIYLDADCPKPSGISAKEKADIISSQKISAGKIDELSARLGIDTRAMRRVAWLCGARPSPVTAILLAGGKSTRMGKDKRLLKVNGVPLVNRLCATLGPLFDQLIIATGTDGPSWNGFRSVIDRFPASGPLSGIHAGLSASETEHNFVIACDIPNVNLAALRKLISLSEDCDIVMPSFGNGLAEPLFAFYRKQVVETALKLLQKGRFQVRALMEECNSHVVNFPDTGWYVNLNTPEDFGRFLARQSAPSTEYCTQQTELK
jgi:molybdopterin-guanine dinucleotide biosynthesis protein A